MDTKEDTVPALLRKIDPMMRYQLSISNKVKLIETLKEVKMQACARAKSVPKGLQ